MNIGVIHYEKWRSRAKTLPAGQYHVGVNLRWNPSITETPPITILSPTLYIGTSLQFLPTDTSGYGIASIQSEGNTYSPVGSANPYFLLDIPYILCGYRLSINFINYGSFDYILEVFSVSS